MGLHCPDMTPASGVSRRLLRRLALVASAVSLPLPLGAQPPAMDAPRVGLYDTVAAVLLRGWPDPAKRRFIVAPLIEENRARADSALTFGEEVGAVQALLRKIPSSHLALTSTTAYHSLTAGMAGKREPTFGLQLMRWAGRWYATSVLDGGPAERAGIRNWDEISSIDGVSPDRNERLDFSTDDAYLDDELDPPMHPLRVKEVDTARFTLRIATDSVLDVSVTASPYSAWDGTQGSVDVLSTDGIRIGYVHLWYMFTIDIAGWLADRFDNDWRNVDGLVLDLRGRGGDAGLGIRIAALLSGSGRERRFRGPVVALQDRQTRSAKEVFAELLRRQNIARLVGEPRAGAVVSSSSVALGHGMTLVLPDAQDGPRFERMELHPQLPDVAVTWGGPLSGARDPILQAGFREVTRLVRENGRGVVLPRLAPLLEGKTMQLRP